MGNKVSKAIPCRLNPVPARIYETKGPILVIKGLKLSPTKATVKISMGRAKKAPDCFITLGPIA